MGKAGSFTRILGPRLGAALCYGSVENPTADGQISLSELLDVYGIARRDRPERIFAVYGGDVTSSLSPLIHNSLFSRRSLPFLYVPISASHANGSAPGRVLRSDLEALDAAEIPIGGLSITNPFKSAFESVVEAIDEDDAVARTGAANTMVWADGAPGPRILARNTDAEAVLEILSARGLAGRRVAILGAGGAARAAAYAAVQAGCEVSILGRDLQRVRSMADRFGGAAMELCDLPKIEADVLVNATPLGGGDEDPRPFPAVLLDRRPAVLDFAYRRSGETPLAAEANRRGCEVADGREILARQAAGQAKLFGVPDATFEEIESILKEAR